jgi:hypothetical protein
MNCPSCAYENSDKARCCGRCRTEFSGAGLWPAAVAGHAAWIFRRASAGFLAGAVAWTFIPALSRVLSQDASATLYFALEGLLGGAFLGTVDGMIEDSTPKSLQGALIGGVCGLIGGGIFGFFSSGLSPQQTAWSLCAFWAFVGAGIGLLSALWERTPRKLIVGALAGLVGGGIGGGLRYAVYAYLIDQFNPDRWFVRRLYEGFSGGLIGVMLWFGIALAERFVVFRRQRIETGKSYKTCAGCGAHNPLANWYCVSCGAVLQESSPPSELDLTAYPTIERFADFLGFLSRLAVTAGVIAGIVIFIVFVPVNVMLAFAATLLVVIAGAGFQALFSALSESLRILIRKP